MNDVRASIEQTINRLRALRGSSLAEPLGNRIKEFAQRSIGRTAVGLDSLFGVRSGRRLGILTYHRVCPHVSGMPSPLYNVTPEQFRAHVAGLLRRGFQVWSLDETLDAAAEGRECPENTVVLTFDDGYASIHQHVWPVLQEFNISCTVFLCTSYLDAAGPFWFDAWGSAFAGRAPAETYCPLTTLQCREMIRAGHLSVGAHTHTHDDFRGRPAAFERDLIQSIDIVRERFDLERVTFAFPYGKPRVGFTDPELVAAVKRAGAACALSTEEVTVSGNPDPFSWGRFDVNSWDSAASLAAKLDGWYSWAPKLRRRFGRTPLRIPQQPVPLEAGAESSLQHSA